MSPVLFFYPQEIKLIVKKNIYKVTADFTWGEEQESLRKKQLEILSDLGLKEEDAVNERHVYCDADSVLSLVMRGYCGDYRIQEKISLVYTNEQGMEADTVKEMMSVAIDGVKKAAEDFYNDKCEQQQPGAGLFSVDSIKLLENACSDEVQDNLNKGWRILSVNPQPDQRRPDYILGRAGQEQTSALRR